MFYWILPHQYRWVALLAANVIFYASFEARFLLLILLLTIVSYFCALGLERKGKGAGALFAVPILLIVLSLAVFKYTGFALNSVQKILDCFAIPFTAPVIRLLQPVGVSFFSFQMIGYLADVYRGKTRACRHFGKYAVFVSFFATITSGPIERAGHFLPQLEEKRDFQYEDAACGATLLLIGLFKKIVIADVVAKYVDNVYNNLHGSGGASVLAATLLFALQSYCDFSGYSDMAVGLAKLLGIDLIQNFKQPYFARSIKGFWASWHISLSTWLKDYIYIPLGGNRKGALRRSLNLLITFLVSGLWHGASWTYVVWGGVHGVAQIVENAVYSKTDACKPPVGAKDGLAKPAVIFCQHVITLFVICLAWVFFRANSISDAFYALTHQVTGLSVTATLQALGMTWLAAGKVCFLALLLWIYDLLATKGDPILALRTKKWPLRWGLYRILGVSVIVLRLHNGADASFIYFQF